MTRGTITPDDFYRTLFSSKSAQNGAVVRRQISDVERYVGRGPLIADMKRRGFPVIENAGQFVVFCNSEPLRRLV